MARGAKIEVRVVVEGGGDAKVQDGPFREGYGAFLRKMAPSEVDGRPVALEVVRGKGGGAALGKFRDQRALYPDALLILLIDSEGPVPEGTSVWGFVRARHGFERPVWAEEGHAFLMVQCVETWLVADPDALASSYGQGFKRERLPKRTDLEEEPKADVQRKLEAAVSGIGGGYRHGDSARLIARTDPDKVSRLAHGARLRHGLSGAIEAFVRSQAA